MKLRIEARLGYVLVGLSGGLGDADVADLRPWLDRALFPGRPEEEPAPFLVWDLTGSPVVEPRFFGSLAGFAVSCRLRGQRVSLAAPSSLVGELLDESGTRGVFHHTEDVAAAFRHILADLNLEDPGAYFRFLADHSYASETDVTSLSAQAPILGEELVERGEMSWGELVTSRFHFKLGGTIDLRAPERRGEIFTASNEGPRPAAPAPPVEDKRGSLFARASAENRKLGEILLDLGLVTPEQLQEALDTQRHVKSTSRLGNILIQMNAVTMEQIFAALEKQYDRRKPARGRRTMDSISTGGARGGAWEKTALSVSNSLLGEVFINRGFVTREQLEKALQEQWRAGGRERLGSVLLRLEMVTSEQVFAALEEQAQRKDKIKKEEESS